MAKRTRLAVRVILNSFVARDSIVAGAIFEGLVLDFVLERNRVDLKPAFILGH